MSRKLAHNTTIKTVGQGFSLSSAGMANIINPNGVSCLENLQCLLFWAIHL
jgi:hypothetical protein